MRFKPKTVRRLLLLTVVLALILGAAFSLFFVRRWQTGRQLAAYRRDGMAALSAGQHRKSLADLGRYIQRGHRSDAEALLAFAQARAALEEPDFTHIRNAIQAYQQYLAIRPDDAVQRMELLKLCNQAGSWVDARDAAERLRPADFAACGPQHIDALREEAIALTAARMDGTRLDSVVTRLLELNPLDLQGQLIRLEVWGRTGRAEEAERDAIALGAAHPADPVARLIAAASGLIRVGDQQDLARVARVKMATALGIDPITTLTIQPVTLPNADFVSRAVDIMDRIAAPDLSLAVLKRWREANPGPPSDRLATGLLRTLARRLWQQGEHDACAAILDGAAPSSVDSEVLAFGAMSLQRSSDPARRAMVRSIIDALRSRPDDFRAQAWAEALPMTDPARAADPKADVETLKALAKSTNRIEPVLLVMLGESYAALSRMDEARQLWRDAGSSPVCASWPYPHMRTAETLLAEGRPEDGKDAASTALLIAHANPAVNALWFEMQAALVQKGAASADPLLVLQSLERVIAQVERVPRTAEVWAIWERLLVPRVLLLARTGDPRRAIEVVRTALDDPHPLSERTLQRLATVGSSERLGIEKECLDRAASINGASPSVAFAKAMELAQAGDAEAGLSVMRNAAAGGTCEARLLLAQYLERIGHAGAAQAWVALGDDFASDLSVQRACLWSGVVGGERDFVERTVGRYQQLSGRDATTEDAAVHTARARVLLNGTPSSKDRDAAVARLALVVGNQPALVEPKVLLARALLQSDAKRGVRPDEARAAALLTEALTLEPRSASITLELAQVLVRRGDRVRAMDILSKLAQDPVAGQATRHGAARMLLAFGGDAAATGLKTLEELERSAPGGALSPVVLSDLAEAYALAKQDAKAEETYDTLVRHDDVKPEHLFAAARFHQRQRHGEAVSRVLARLGQLQAPPEASALIMARLAEDRGDGPEAIRRFEEAVSLGPSSAEAWRSYIGALLSKSQGTEAAEVAARAVKAVPDDASLKVLLEQARLASAPANATSDLAPLIAALSADPTMAGASEVLRALDEASQRGDLERLERIAELADRFPAVPLLQVYLAQRVVVLDAEKAAQLVGRARAQAPADAKVSKGAAEVYLALGRWTDMLNAAMAWRDSAGGSGANPEPDIAIAQARLNLHDYRGGLAAVKGWVDEAAADPAGPHALSVLNMQTRLLIASDREADARALLESLLTSSAQVRTAIWLRSAGEALPSTALANEWIAKVRPTIPVDAAEEQLSVAAAWSVLATRFPAEATPILTEARGFLKSLTEQSATSTAATWEALGVVCHRLGDIAAAQEAYERSLAMDGRRVICLNNLASILAETKSDPNAALPLARRAVDVSNDAASLSTLASVQIAIAEAAKNTGGQGAAFKDAAETYRRLAKLRPGDAQVWSRAAQAAFDAGEFAESAAAWERVAAMPGLPASASATAKNNQANAILRQDGGKDQVERAQALITQAIAANDLPAFQDTLGWIELAAGKREAAAATFRRSIGSGEAGNHSSRIGLAMALAGGTDEERREAAKLAAGVDSKGLDPFLARKLQSLLALVQVEKP
jgi:tetratricopeptide (TPR) repeat protein